ncbi:MAG: helix-turn-helix transcriptional regulator [Patescibacteria group bacterium]|jgi:transcriptional regulator with XRE-family HTH domain
MSTLGNRLKLLREAKNCTQKTIADRLGICREGYTYYELNNREPNIKTIIKLAEFFNCTTDYLLCNSNNSNMPFLKNNNIDTNITLGNRLKKLRYKLDKNKNQAETARKLGISPINYNRFEHDVAEPSYKILLNIAKFHNCTTDDLFGITNTINNIIVIEPEPKNNNNIIKILRKKKNVTQKQLAKEISVTKGTVSSWENNQSVPPLVYLERLSKYFSVTADLLLEIINTSTDVKNNIIKSLRQKKYLTQKQLAKEISTTQAITTQAMISKWELGQNKIPAVQLKKLAKYFSVTTTYLLKQLKQPTNPNRSNNV